MKRHVNALIYMLMYVINKSKAVGKTVSCHLVLRRDYNKSNFLLNKMSFSTVALYIYSLATRSHKGQVFDGRLTVLPSESLCSTTCWSVIWCFKGLQQERVSTKQNFFSTVAVSYTVVCGRLPSSQGARGCWTSHHFTSESPCMTTCWSCQSKSPK